MGKHAYRAGDVVLVKRGLFRKDDHDRKCSVSAVLPETQGLAQYRVQFSNESFARHITEDDVDRTDTPAARRGTPPSTPTSGDARWINTSSIKIRK